MTHGARSALTVSVGGGKGGVGKSVVASNLGIAMARLGFRTVLVDADLGAANQHTLFGMERPGRTLQAFIDKTLGSLEEAVVPTEVPRLCLLPGTSGVAGAANLGHARKLKLLRHLQALDADAIIIDCGAGASLNVLDFYDLADLRVVVTTPQLTALQNAYGFLKSAVYRSLRQCALTAQEQNAFDNATTRCETERVGSLLGKIEASAPSYAATLRSHLAFFGARLIGNQLEHAGQQRTFSAFTRMAKDFLDLDVPVMGALPASPRVHASVTRRRPLLLDDQTGPVAQTFNALAEQLLTIDPTRLREGRRRESEGHSEQPGPIANYVRRHARVETHHPVTVSARGRSAPGDVVDVSDSGMRVATLLPIAPGARVVVRFDDADAFGAKVRWAKRGEVGLELTDPSAGRKLLQIAARRDIRIAASG